MICSIRCNIWNKFTKKFKIQISTTWTRTWTMDLLLSVQLHTLTIQVHLRWWLVTQLSCWSFPGLPQPGNLCTDLSFTQLSPISFDGCEWHNTQDKWLFVRNLDRSPWHCHTSIKLFFGCSPLLHGQQLICHRRQKILYGATTSATSSLFVCGRIPFYL